MGFADRQGRMSANIAVLQGRRNQREGELISQNGQERAEGGGQG